MRRTDFAIVLVAVAALAGVLAYLAGRELSAPEAAPPAPADVTIPERRPDVTLPDRDGRLRSLSEWDGRTLVVNFWATWCAPCRREIPMLNALARDYAAEGVEVIGIAVDFREEVLAYVQSTPIDYPVLIGEQDGLDAAAAFGMETIGFPATVFVEPAGRIVTIHLGELHRPQAELILGLIARHGRGELDMEAVRVQIREGMDRLGVIGG